MALSQPRTIFGIHQITPYNRTTRVPYGTAKVLGGSTFTLSGETVDLFGGSSKYAWQVEDGTISAELAMTLREYPNFGFEVFLGKALTENTSETTGDVSSLTNRNGTSLQNASTGIASIAALGGDESDLKFGTYTAIAATSTTINIAASSDVDFARGTDTTYVNDNLYINSSPIGIVDSSATVAVEDYGLVITSGSGTVDMTIGDTASFEVRPVNTANQLATFGGTSDTYPEFGCLVYAQQQGTGNMFEIDVFRCKVLGMPIGFTANEFSEGEVTAKAFYDSARNGVFSIRNIEI